MADIALDNAVSVEDDDYLTDDDEGIGDIFVYII